MLYVLTRRGGRKLFGNAELARSYVLDLQPLHMRTDAHPGSAVLSPLFWIGAGASGGEGRQEDERWSTRCLQ
jgi:hypothetical protein